MHELKKLVWQLTRTDWAPNGWEVIWLHEPLPFEGLRNGALGAYVELNITNFRSLGEDDYRQAYIAASDSMQSTLYGLRIFTLSMDCRSFSLDAPAFDILEAVRVRLNNRRSAEVNEAMRSVGIAWVRSHPIVTLSADKQDVDLRMIWRNVLDVEFSWVSASFSTDDAGGYVKTVGVVPDGSPAGTNAIPGIIMNPDGHPWPTP